MWARPKTETKNGTCWWTAFLCLEQMLFIILTIIIITIIIIFGCQCVVRFKRVSESWKDFPQSTTRNVILYQSTEGNLLCFWVWIWSGKLALTVKKYPACWHKHSYLSSHKDRKCFSQFYHQYSTMFKRSLTH